MVRKKKGIALLITLIFIIAITASIGIGLKYVNDASDETKSDGFLFQNRVIVKDFLEILKTSTELDEIAKNKSPEGLYNFLLRSENIQLNSSGVDINIEITSARAKINPNTFMDKNNTINKEKIEIVKQYFANYMLNDTYVEILLDNMNGIKKDNSYRTGIFNEKPYLFRDYIASKEHLYEINDFYEKAYYENSLKNINFDNLFYFTQDRGTIIDINYATAEVWEMILGVNRERAIFLASGTGSYIDEPSLSLSDEESLKLKQFKFSYFEPYLNVNIKVSNFGNKSEINFIYNLENKKGSEFNYDI